tara:strand:- start:1137 stop:1373 length:237 start_codon:yes stop_codon:yes gene_type:complete
MNDYEIQQMKDQLERLDSMMRLLAAKECNCMACLLNGCNCCTNKKDTDTLISDYESEIKRIKLEREFKENKKNGNIQE